MKNYKLAVVGVVEYNDEILIGKKVKNRSHMSKEWHVPGGKVENETLEEAVVREIREEAGILVRVDKLLAKRTDDIAGYKVLWYLCTPLTHNLIPGTDIEDVKYVSKSKIKVHCGTTAISLWPQEFLDYIKIK